jgi:hypothetical protein
LMYRHLNHFRTTKRETSSGTRGKLSKMVSNAHKRGVSAHFERSGKKQKHLKNMVQHGRLQKNHNWMGSGSGTPFLTAVSAIEPQPQPANLKQTTLTATQKARAMELDYAIADFIHCNGVRFNMSEDFKFKNMIALARHVAGDYTPPARASISGPLLDGNYERLQTEQDSKLLKDAKLHGLLAFADAATVGKNPFINFMASSPNNPAVCLEIHDCTPHMANGGIKDAEYVSVGMLKHMDRLDPTKELFDMITFDGGSNFQSKSNCRTASHD